MDCRCAECDQKAIHKEVIDKVTPKLVDENILIELSEFFKIYGDSTRIKVINVLMNSKMCVCDIAYILNMSQSSISHQLKILKQAKIVKFKKVGKVVYYALDDEHIGEIFNKGVEHIEE